MSTPIIVGNNPYGREKAKRYGQQVRGEKAFVKNKKEYEKWKKLIRLGNRYVKMAKELEDMSRLVHLKADNIYRKNVFGEKPISVCLNNASIYATIADDVIN